MTNAPTRAPAWQVWTALGVVYVVWGSTYLAIVYVVETVPPLLGAGVRFSLATAVMGLVLAVRSARRSRTGRPAPPRATPRQAWFAAGLGVLLLAGGNGGVTLAEEQGLPSGLAALLVAGLPLLVVVLRLLDGDRPHATTMVGVLVGLGGLAVLLLPGSRPEGVGLGSAGLVLAGTLTWGIGSFLASKGGLPADPVLVATLQMAGGAAALLLAGVLHGERLDLAAVSTASVVALLYLALAGSVVAFSAYSWLLGHAPVSQASTYAYVNPVVAVALGALVVGEAVPATTVLGGAVTLVAVGLVVTSEGRRRGPRPGRGGGAGRAGQVPIERQGRARRSAT